jgi:Uma2 family endonuclease
MPQTENLPATASEMPTADVVDPLYRITADDFQRMVEAGVLPADRRIYLWDGVLCEKMAKTRAHAIQQDKLNTLLVKRVPDGWYVSAENPLNLDMTKTPLPDFAIVRGSPEDYPERPPRGTDAALVIEVMVTSKKKDREVHQRASAVAGVPTYWVVDVEARAVWVYTEPSPPGQGKGGAPVPEYRVQTKVPAGGTLELSLPGHDPIRIDVDEILARKHD